MGETNNITDEQLNDECSDETIILNVGGIKYETYQSTLTAYPDTFLGTMFQKRNRSLLIPRNGNEYFFDRSGQIFHYVMQFYRTGKLNLENQLDSVSITPKEIEIELDFFQIPRPTSIDKIAITKIRNLINAFNQLISKVVESYLKESSFKTDIDVLFLSNGQATVHALLDENNLSDVFLDTKRYAYNIMTLYKDIIKERLENEYPELTWVHQHNGEDLQYWKIKLSISWTLNKEKIIKNL
ncbi:5061_t:CDS:2 [Cetraspora pellucida]|uniref:5061_t:CDS:1 n=1 Tax=Cetraspora pellucida TaxID=1433469 RepID=A0A9N9AFV6_9GLOM|nr:5061_t:CDS:2 [Cetraspora pellucida]